MLFISHRLAEVRAICDRATVLRDGRDVGVLDLTEGGEERIVELMLGPARATAPAEKGQVGPGGSGRSGEALLSVRDLGLGSELQGVSFSLARGEVLGVAALEGQGQEALFDALSGRRPATAGEVRMRGGLVTPRGPYDAIRAGLVLVPSDRLLGLLPQRSVAENMALPLYNRAGRWGVINGPKERDRVGSAIARLQIDTRAQRQVRWLSGGNQQKVTIARWVASGFDVLLCFDPTRGIDVGTKRQIYTLLRELAGQGACGAALHQRAAGDPAGLRSRAGALRGAGGARAAGRAADEATLLRAAHGIVAADEVAV